MPEWIVAHEAPVRLTAFLSVLALLLAAQERWPRRASAPGRGGRWRVNLSMVVLGALVARAMAGLVMLLGAVAAAQWAARHGVGVLAWLRWPALVEGTLAFLALDGAIYWQHRLFHRLPLFWRLHRMHHSDLDFDATTGVRFHPVEIGVSMLIKVAVVLALGAPAVAVVLFEIALNATSLFNHSNLRLPAGLDGVLRKLIVTPDMHRVHHSVQRREHDSNYGFNLSWWDHLFGSYTAQPVEGHTTMRIGLPAFRDAADQRLGPLLLQPLKKRVR